MSGTVESVGADVEGWSAGDLVTVMPLLWDGTCPACRAGNSHVCQNLTFIGIDSPGALQARWNVPAQTLVAAARGHSTCDTAALVEPVAVAVHDVRRGGVERGDRVVVLGGGPIGTLIASVARHVGAEVVVIEPDARRREQSRSWASRAPTRREHDVAAWVERVDGRCRRRRGLRGLGRAAAVARATGAGEGPGHGRRRRDPPRAARGRPAAGVLAGAAHPGRPRLPTRGLRDGGRAAAPTALPAEGAHHRAPSPLAEVATAFDALGRGPRHEDPGRRRRTAPHDDARPSTSTGTTRRRHRCQPRHRARHGARRSPRRAPTSSASARRSPSTAARSSTRCARAGGRSTAYAVDFADRDAVARLCGEPSPRGRRTSWSTTPGRSRARPPSTTRSTTGTASCEVNLTSQFVLTQRVGAAHAGARTRQDHLHRDAC